MGVTYALGEAWRGIERDKAEQVADEARQPDRGYSRQ
jgi:hypothetical protein